MAPPADALKDLTEISTQIESAVVLDREGTVVASTLDDDRAGRLAGSALELLRAAEEVRPQDAGVLVQLDVLLELPADARQRGEAESRETETEASAREARDRSPHEEEGGR